MARQSWRDHDDTEPGEVANVTSTKHITAPARGGIKGKPDSSGRSSRSSMVETLGAGGDEAESTGKQSGRSCEQAGAPSQDLPDAPHLGG
jgi:hypothetical protein